MKKGIFAFSFGFVLSLLFAGCGERATDAESVVAPTADASVQVSSRLAGTQWEVKSVEGVDLPASMRRPHLRFDADGARVSGFSGVNRISGGYTELSDRIRLGNLAGTKMAGPPEAMAFELAFMQMLRGALEWTLESDRLILTREDGVTIHLSSVAYTEE